MYFFPVYPFKTFVSIISQAHPWNPFSNVTKSNCFSFSFFFSSENVSVYLSVYLCIYLSVNHRILFREFWFPSVPSSCIFPTFFSHLKEYSLKTVNVFVCQNRIGRHYCGGNFCDNLCIKTGFVTAIQHSIVQSAISVLFGSNYWQASLYFWIQWTAMLEF